MLSLLNVQDKDNAKLSNLNIQNLPLYPIAIVGELGSGKTNLLNQIKNIYTNEGIIVYSFKLSDQSIQSDTKMINVIKDEMMNRYKQLEDKNINTYTKLNLSRIAVFIDDIDKLKTSKDIETKDDAHNAIGSLVRLGKNAGIQLIYACEDLDNVVKDITLNTNFIICLRNVAKTLINEDFELGKAIITMSDSSDSLIFKF